MNIKYSKLGAKKWIIIIILIAVLCIGLILGVVFIEESHTEKGKDNILTIEKVKQLSKKGDKLSWEDFEAFNGTEIGSGLYIKTYPIDDKYSLLIGSGSSQKPLMYIYLNNNDNQKYIDIRYDDIDKFLHKN